MLEFLRQILSTESGQGSSNRACLVVTVASLVCWASLIAWRTGAIPEIPDSWIYVIGIFVSGSFAAKANDTYKTVKTPPPIQESSDA